MGICYHTLFASYTHSKVYAWLWALQMTVQISTGKLKLEMVIRPSEPLVWLVKYRKVWLFSLLSKLKLIIGTATRTAHEIRHLQSLAERNITMAAGKAAQSRRQMEIGIYTPPGLDLYLEIATQIQYALQYALD